MNIGIFLSVLASALFGVLYYFSALLNPLNGLDIFAWRLILSTPIILVFVIVSGNSQYLTSVIRRIKSNPSLFFVLLLSSFLLGIQLWLFLWAPTVHKALEVSLGYFMLPLSLVLTGKLFFNERLSKFQLLATAIASFGVIHEIFRSGVFSIAALTVVIGYPLYFSLRRYFQFDHIGGLCFDLLLLIPIALIFAFNGTLNVSFLTSHTDFYFLLPIFGLLSATALISYILSTRYLTLGLFGLLSYLEPVFLLVVAYLLGESISRDELFTYLPIYLAVAILFIEGIFFLFKKRRFLV